MNEVEFSVTLTPVIERRNIPDGREWARLALWQHNCCVFFMNEKGEGEKRNVHRLLNEYHAGINHLMMIPGPEKHIWTAVKRPQTFCNTSLPLRYLLKSIEEFLVKMK